MKKLIYAVKNGRKTGVFKEWLKCSEQTNGYSNSIFRSFKYRSELEEESEDVPGSLRYAMKKAEEYLEDLVYLGESADYLEDEMWAEEGFLPFGTESEAENRELFHDKKDQDEEDIEDAEEQFNKRMSARIKESFIPTAYWVIAEDMKKCIAIIRSRQSDHDRKNAADRLKRHLNNCLSDVNLNELTSIYRDQNEKNAIGYNPPAAVQFVTALANRYPKPDIEETKEEEFSMQQLLLQSGAVECELKEMIFGQDEAIEKLREEYFNRELTLQLQMRKNGPRNVFLLAGPPGVGKTFMARQFAERLGLPVNRFDMSGYSNKESIQELVGFAPTWANSEPGLLTKFVSLHPKSVLIFDEIEKAHITVIRLFLQILDGGFCEDKYNRRNVSFEDTIIFFTTNAGRQLYIGAQNENLSSLPNQVVVDALAKDKDSDTKQAFFPPEILSRMSSYTIIMLNHLKANVILELVEKDIKKRLKEMEKTYGYDLKQGAEYLARTILYSMGGSADARNATQIAGKVINKEMYELLKLVEEKQGLDKRDTIKTIEWKCDLADTSEEIRDFYSGERDCVIPVFGTVKYKSAGRIKSNNICVKNTVNINEFMNMIHKENVLFTVIDYIYGPEASENGLSVVDTRTVGRDALLQLREEDKEIPVYLLDGSHGHVYTEKEKNSLMKKGVGGFIESKFFGSQLEAAYMDVCCQTVMKTLTMRHQILTYETKKEFDEKTNVGSIVFGDFKLETAVDSEDKSSILSDDLRPNKSWDDIYVSKDLKKEIVFFIRYLQNPKKFSKTGVKPRGVLLYGDPGTGKTLLAKVVAAESGVNFLSVSASELLNGGSEKVMDTFRIARKYAPAILFIDEIDAIGMSREYFNEPNPTLNQLLTEMDGFKKVDNKPVFVMAATNHEEKLDPALLRRFGGMFEMGCLDAEGRKWQLKRLIQKQSEMFQVSKEELESIVVRSEKWSPAVLEKVVEAALREGIQSGRIIDDDLFDEVFERCIMGEERIDISQKDTEKTAYHEAGHALIHLYYGKPPAYLTVVSRGSHGGYVQSGTGSRCSTKKEYLERICFLLGGRAAEMVFADVLELGDGLTYGPTKDLQIATNIATHMVCKLGMYEEEVGLAVTREIKLPNGEIEFECDEKSKALINRILSEQLKEAKRIIEMNKDAMERLVKAVMESKRKYLTGKQILEAAGDLNQ